MVALESAGVWGTPTTLAGSVAELTSVHCQSVGTCTAVGYTPNQFPAAVTVEESAGVWGTQSVVAGMTQLFGVSCLSSVACTAVGGNSIIQQPFAPPTIASFSPSSGPVGTVVTIKGSNFVGGTKVTIGGVAMTVTKGIATKIKVRVPVGATTGKIKVTTPGGTAKTATAFTKT